MRILVTGGFGFVGGRLAKHLTQAGHQVVLGTRNSVYRPKWLPEAEVVKMSWDDDSTLQKNCKGVDVVIHAAGMNASDSLNDPVAALAFNGLATARLVAAASRVGVSKFVYLSTAHVYGDRLEGFITEETCPRNLHPYATSHLAGEHAVLSASSQNVTHGIVLRLSNAFGFPMHRDVNCWALVVNDLCRQAVETRKLVLKTNGLQQRDFIALTTVCDVTEQLIIDDAKFMNASVLNVGAGVSQSIHEMAIFIQQRCSNVLGFEPELLTEPRVVNEIHSKLSYDIEHLKSLNISVNNLNNVIEVDKLLQFSKTTFKVI